MAWLHTYQQLWRAGAVKGAPSCSSSLMLSIAWCWNVAPAWGSSHFWFFVITSCALSGGWFPCLGKVLMFCGFENFDLVLERAPWDAGEFVMMRGTWAEGDTMRFVAILVDIHLFAPEACIRDRVIRPAIGSFEDPHAALVTKPSWYGM